MADGGFTNNITVEIRAIARKSYIPIITKERFDILIKMAESFQALAEKGYPGTLELATKTLNLLGEHFFTVGEHINSEATDSTELLKMQSIFLKSLKDEKFYNKKLQDFTRKASIHLETPSFNETAKAKEVAKKIRISHTVAKEQALRSAALRERMVTLKQLKKIINDKKHPEKLKNNLKNFLKAEQDKFLLEFNTYLSKEKLKRARKIEILSEVSRLNNQKELDHYLDLNPDAITTVNELRRNATSVAFSKIKLIANATLVDIKKTPDVPAEILTTTDLKRPEYKIFINDQPFPENLKTILFMETNIEFEDKKSFLQKIKKENEYCKNELKKTQERLKRDSEAVQEAIEEANVDDTRAKFDAVAHKFNTYFHKTLEDKNLNRHFDTNAMALLASVNNAITSVQEMNGTRKTLDMIIPFLWIKESNPANKDTTISKIVRKMISDPMATQKMQISALTEAVRKSAMPDFEFEEEQAPEKPAASTIYDAFSALQQNLSTLLKAVRGDFNDEFSSNAKNIRDLIKTSRNETTKITFEVFEKTYQNFKQLDEAALIKSSEWKKQVESMRILSDRIVEINEKQQLLLEQRKSQGSSVKVEKDLIELEEEKYDLFLEVSKSIRTISTLPVEKNNEHLLALVSVSKFVLTGIDYLDWYLEIISKGHQEYLEHTDLYQDPFEAMQKISKENEEYQNKSQDLFGSHEGNADFIKSKIQNFLQYSVGQFTRSQMARRLMFLDQFGGKLKLDLQEGIVRPDLIASTIDPESNFSETEDPLEAYFTHEGTLGELTKNAAKKVTSIRTTIDNTIKDFEAAQEKLEAEIQKKEAEKIQEKTNQSYFARLTNLIYSTPLDTEIAELKTALLKNEQQQKKLEQTRKELLAFKGMALNLTLSADTDPRKTAEELHKKYIPFRDALIDPNTPNEIKKLLEQSDQLYVFLANWLIRDQINSTYQVFSSIRDKLRTTPNDAKAFEELLSLIEKIRILEEDAQKNEVSSKPINNLVRLKEAIYSQAKKEISMACQNLNPENLHQKQSSHYGQALKTGNMFLDILKKFPMHFKTPELNESEVQLKNQIKKAKTFKNLGGHLSFSIGEFSTTQSHSTVKKLYKVKNTKTTKLLRKTQLYVRKDELNFLQKVIDLLNENKDQLSDTKKAAIFLGAINYLDKAQSTYFTVGMNNLKTILHHMRNTVFLEIKKTSPTTYKKLEDDSKKAIELFVKSHLEGFENNATANKLLKENKSALLLTAHQKKSKQALISHSTTKPSTPGRNKHS